MSRRSRRFPETLGLTTLLALAAASPAGAVDKQGSAHGGEVGGATSGFAVSGSAILGIAVYNPSYAARPDNSGLALMRYAGHADVDLIGQRLSIPIDVNLFSDRLRSGIGKLAPTELDVITGLTTTWAAGPGAVEAGARVEHDRPVDRDGASQTYGDVRGRYLWSLAKIFPGLAGALRGGDVSGWSTLGWFAYNRSYFARPDNTGRALFRYALHAELSLWNDLLSLGADTTFFTDRFATNPIRPSELDLTLEVIFHRGDFEAHLAWETDMPVDRSGLVQRFVYLLGVWSFGGFTDGGKQAAPPRPFEDRGQILSP